MRKKGYYFIINNIFNKRAHSIQTIKTVEAINKQGYNLEIVAPKFQNYDFIKINKYYQIKNKIKFNLLPILGFKKISKLEIIIFNFVSIFYLIYLKFFGKVKYVYIRNETLFPFIFFTKFFLKIDYYYEVHRVGKNNRQEKIKKFLVKNAKSVIVLTKELKIYYSQLNKNIVVAHDAVEAEYFFLNIDKMSARKRTGLPLSKKIVLYTGSISKIKGVDIIINNANKFPDINFYLIGKKRDNINTENVNFSNNLYLLGEKNYKDIPYYLAAADLLVLPHSQNVQSQSPMKLFEYMTSGVPILSSDLSNIREVLSNDEAIFYKPNNDYDFCDKINKYFNNQNKYLQLSKKAKNKVREYTWDKRASKIINIID